MTLRNFEPRQRTHDIPRRDEDKTLRTRDGLRVHVTYRDDEYAACSYAGCRESAWHQLWPILDDEREPYELRQTEQRATIPVHRDTKRMRGIHNGGAIVTDAQVSVARKNLYMAVLKGEKRPAMPLREVAAEYATHDYNTPMNRYLEQSVIGAVVCTVAVYLGDSLLVKLEVAGIPNAHIGSRDAERIERQLIASAVEEARDGLY